MHGKAEAEPEPLTLETLFDIYGEEVTPTKGERSRMHDRAATRMFLQFFGRDRKPASFSQRDWDRFIRARRSGKVGPSGRPVSDRTIEYDLKFLIAVFKLGCEVEGRAGPPAPRQEPAEGPQGAQGEEPGPGRPCRGGVPGASQGVLPDRLAVSCRAGGRARDGTPHRCHPPDRWSDIDMEGGVVRWRAEHDKSGYEHRTPVTAEAIAALEEARKRNPGIGDTPLLPRGQESLGVRGLRTGARLVEERPEPRGTRPEARQRLALPEAEVRFGSHGPAAQGALRTRRLEDGPNRAPVLPAAGRGTAQEGARETPENSRLIQSAGIKWRESSQSIS